MSEVSASFSASNDKEMLHKFGTFGCCPVIFSIFLAKAMGKYCFRLDPSSLVVAGSLRDTTARIVAIISCHT